jgi:hypothetical protein
MKKLRRSIYLVGLALGSLTLAPTTASAAGCHTLCQLVTSPECMGCGFTAFQNVFCLRSSCDRCEEDSCSFATAPGDDLASNGAQAGGCLAPSKDAPPAVRIVKVQTMASRS